ncbi:DDB1- and CUL4-associated factor 13 [Histomonas meleagridis]|uniref:DDB1- and CUL4-associated factor 13 n=1 Tax=Histomonas meleagridis TaxID=135588 RepID=UPI00355A651D|nr:DDB1- and CUL4-associated factor 13 [Histomonas meleagridis]KAH0806690.1 DDB1- and CUL4-associated factor 13 [Histomonas meleagridis]
MEKPKVSVIARREADFGRGNRSEALKIFKNTSPDLHPLAQNTEYVRAVRAAKMKKMFSKPFIGSLDGHSDSVYSLTRHPRNFRTVVSGGADGDIRVWDVTTRECKRVIKAHPLIVNDVCCSPTSDLILSVGSDSNVCGFSTDSNFAYASDGALNGVDHSWANDNFVTAGSHVDLWSPLRNTPIQRFEWGNVEYIDSVFNQSEVNLILACGNDRSVIVADTRTRGVARSITLQMKTNAVDWNPQIPYYFITANDDTGIYLFDMRKTETAVRVYTDHLGPVTCINFSPNGKQFVSGSYDATIRIWDWENIRSRDCYHTHRMQRVYCVCVSPDGKFALCGSEDMNIRIFKTKANEELRVLSKKEKKAQQYQEKLLEKFKHSPEVHAIAEKQNLPKKLYNKRKQRGIMMAAHQRKAIARMAHSANPEENKPVPLRQNRIVEDQT